MRENNGQQLLGYKPHEKRISLSTVSTVTEKKTFLSSGPAEHVIQASVTMSFEEGPNPRSYSTPTAKRHLERRAEANSPGTINDTLLLPLSLSFFLVQGEGEPEKESESSSPESQASGGTTHNLSTYTPNLLGLQLLAHRCSPNTTSCYTSLGLNLHNTHILSFQHPGLLVLRTSPLLQLLFSTHLR